MSQDNTQLTHTLFFTQSEKVGDTLSDSSSSSDDDKTTDADDADEGEGEGKSHDKTNHEPIAVVRKGKRKAAVEQPVKGVHTSNHTRK